VRLRDSKTLRDIVDRRQLILVKRDVDEDAQRKISMKSEAHIVSVPKIKKKDGDAQPAIV
jgi:hypothetical protein